MVELALCLLIILFLYIEFGVYGTGFNKIFRFDMPAYAAEITGFFVYFGVFQIAALPMILLQRSLSELVMLWIGISILVNGYVLIAARRELWDMICRTAAGIWRMKGILLLGVLLLAGVTCYFQAAQPYMGWDTSYYVGTVNTTVYTDSMYIYNGNSGAAEKYLDFRYALSTFYMHSAVWCKISTVSAMMIQKYVMGTVCILTYGLVLFAIGKKLFHQEDRKALLLLGLAFIFNYGFNTIYSTSSFLLLRGYEAKGFCANVVIPAVFYGALCLWEDSRKREYWGLLFMIGFSSVPVSMSSILIVPAMIVIILMAEWLIKKDGKILWNGLWCVIPNAVYLVVYFLYTQGVRIVIL